MNPTFFCDIGNVLVYFCHEKGCKQVADVLGIDPLLLKEKFMPLLTQYESGLMDTEELWSLLDGMAKKHYTQKDLIHAWNDIFVPNNTLFPYIEALKARGVRLVLLSNIGAWHHEHLFETVPTLNEFDGGIFSFQVGCMKPQQQFFEVALEQTGSRPEACFFTDDIPGHVESARSCGITSKCFVDNKTLMKDLEAFLEKVSS